MFRSATLTGRDGAELRWGYLRAASVRTWTLSTQGQTCTFSGQLRDVQTYMLSQQGLSVCLLRPNGLVWQYQIDTLHIAGETVTATVRTQES